MSPYPGKAHPPPRKTAPNTPTAQLHFKKVIDQLLPLLPEEKRSKAQFILLSGERTGFRHDTDRELLFRQESNFFYLTGCDLPSSALLLIFDPSDKKYESHLLIPEEDPLETMWSPPPPTLDAARGMYDATSLGYTSQLATILSKLLPAHPDAVFHTLPKGTDLFPALHPEFSSGQCAGVSTEQYFLTAIHRARLIKTDAEIALMRRANHISSRAHEVVMRLLGQGVMDLNRPLKVKSIDTPSLPADWRITCEAEAEAVFVASCRREGSIHQAYLPIVAASTRASTLHYCCNDKEFAWGPEVHSRADIECDHQHGCFSPQVLLIDAGCEWRNYAADITRVTPVGNGGKFSKEAREIYSLVLKMQTTCEKLAKPGVHWDSLHLKCHEILVEEFLRLGIFTGDYKDVLSSGISSAFFPHGLGHSIGLDVHDVPSASKPVQNSTIPAFSSQNPEFYRYLRLRLPLEKGMCVTIEPGCYFSPHLLSPVRNSQYVNHEVLAKYEYVGGVRIEDVVVITDMGCEVLSPVGKDVEWLEAVASGSI